MAIAPAECPKCGGIIRYFADGAGVRVEHSCKSDLWYVAAATAGGHWDDRDVPRLLIAGPWPRAQADEWLKKTRQRFVDISCGLMHEDDVKALQQSEEHRTEIKRAPS